MKQVLCKRCRQWSSESDKCEHCSNVLNEIVIREEAILKKGVNKPKPPGKLQILFDKTKNSKNPFLRMFYYIVMGLWGIYVSLVVMILYLAIAASG